MYPTSVCIAVDSDSLETITKTNTESKCNSITITNTKAKTASNTKTINTQTNLGKQYKN